MLEKKMGAKYWIVMGSVLVLGACANSNTNKDALDNAPAEPVMAEPVEEPVVSSPSESVDVEPTMEDMGTQDSLDAAAADSLVYFGYDQYDLTAEARTSLQSQAMWLQAHGDVRVTIEGHCDERGTREYNLALGDRRANAVKNYLVALGVSPERLHTVSYGKERPAAVGSGEYVWSQNRRSYTRVN